MVRFLLVLSLVCFGSIADAQVLKKVLSPVKQLAQCVGGNCQQSQSFGGYVVGQRDPTDGAVITSVGPVADPVPSLAPALPLEASASPVERSVVSSSGRSDFRSALLKAARQERGESLSFGDYFHIFVGSLDAKKLETAKLAVVDSAIQDGVLPASATAATIDWEKLIELIIKYLPMILQLFMK